MRSPDRAEKARQLLLFRPQSVASGNKSGWTQARDLLGRVLDRVRDPQTRRACRIAALLVDEILQPVLLSSVVDVVTTR